MHIGVLAEISINTHAAYTSANVIRITVFAVKNIAHVVWIIARKRSALLLHARLALERILL